MSELTDLLDEAAVEPKLKFSDWLESLNDKDREAIFSYASSAALSTRKFHEIVTAKGVGISREDFHKWRKQQGLKA